MLININDTTAKIIYVEDDNQTVIRMSEKLRNYLDVKIGNPITIDKKKYIVGKLLQRHLTEYKINETDLYMVTDKKNNLPPIINTQLHNVIVKKDVITLPAMYNIQCFGLGSDPELMLSDNTGKALTADKFLPEVGSFKDGKNKPEVYADGFVAELSPLPSNCRAIHMNGVAGCLVTLDKALEKEEVSFTAKSCFEVDKEELAKATERARMFGCDPSITGQDDIKCSVTVDPRTVDGAKHMKRYAGGHLHIGKHAGDYGTAGDISNLKKYCKEMSKLSDLFVGIPSVMLDREKSSKERRKMYGRAGEYRLPPHGFEYRVPSNFWLRHSALGSFMLGNLRFVGHLVNRQIGNAKKIINGVDWELVVEAINQNSFSKAKKAWIEFARPILIKNQCIDAYHFDLAPSVVPVFEFVAQKGIHHFWSDHVFENWKLKGTNYVRRNGGHDFPGWQVFFSGVLKEAEMSKEYFAFRKELRKKGLEVPGNDDNTCLPY